MKNNKLHGLQKLCKLFGHMKMGEVVYVWDYVNEVALPEKELLADKARWAASEKLKWSRYEKLIKNKEVTNK
jgi:hypothetical protein